ncbi:MAG: hypothetical protein HY019_19020 [Aquabacterium sp.]|uniref:sensor histidine kinase n=1 Tax=Aquabacterium sp. TaxID=1872578 RepID=UPI0025C5ED4B|nr:hybrid sensor histidine kinase/response regulator [Aquabacterium sp.]MBI3384100.1 hypothetical protein [Aquabacterium sp.]
MPELLTLSDGDIAKKSGPSVLTSVAPGAIWRIRTNLALLILACLLPGILLSAWFIVSDYHQRKAQAIEHAISIARATAASLDRDIASVTAGLRVLASTSTLQADDLPGFYTQAQSALPYQNISNYVLIDEAGRQQVNTIVPWGAPLPLLGGPPQLKRIFDTGEPVLTDVFVGPVTGKPILALGVPVKRDGRTLYSLNAGIFPSRFASVLTAQNLPRDWISSVLDSQGHIVARTHEMDRFVGRPAVPDLIRMSRQIRDGVLATVTLEGIPVITAFSRSRVSDWCVAVGIPQAQITGELKRSLITLLVISTLTFALALWMAWWLAMNRVINPTQRLLNRMRAVAHGEAPDPTDGERIPHEFALLEQGFADMGERLREREREREAKLAAEAANLAKTSFLSRMSHELRTPLNAVLGFTQVLLLSQQEPLSPQQREMVQHIDHAGHHLLDMIGDVLDVSRIESGQMHIHATELEVATLIQSCHEMMAPQAQAAGLHFNVSMQGETGRVLTDPTRLKQVLLNLLSNAIKYNRPGGSITLSAWRDGAHVRFAVSDTGLGMAPDQLQHLFEPFNRLGRHSGHIPGAGIGLVICKQLLELMGSTLHVHSQAGQGSEFVFEMPSITR